MSDLILAIVVTFLLPIFLTYLLMLFGFILIRRYRNSDRGIGYLAIITAPRDQTLSCTSVHLVHTFDKQGRMAIIITRTVIGRHLKGFNRQPVGDRVPLRDRTIQHTQIILGYNSDGMIYRIEYRDSEVVSWHILITIITPPKIDIPHNSNQQGCRQHVTLNAVGDIDKGSLAERD